MTGPSTTLEAGWRESRAKHVQAAAIAAVGYPLLRALGSTLRWQVEGLQHLDAIAAGGRRPIYGFWHGRILYGTLYFQHRRIVVVTSENFDGEWIARIIHRFGFETVRGSTSRGARVVVRRLLREIARGRATGFTLDGPRGPARVAQPGAVWVARATGNPVLPFHAEASRRWTLGSWDGTQVPKPFARVALTIGDPMYVPADADDEALEDARVDLERRLAALERRAGAMIGAA